LGAEHISLEFHEKDDIKTVLKPYLFSFDIPLLLNYNLVMAESSSDALSASYIKNLLAALPAILAETKCPSCNSSDESVYHPIEGMKNVKFCSSCDTLFGIDDTMNVNDLRQLVEAGKLRFKTEDSCACGNDDVDAFLIEKCQQTGKLHIRCMNCNFTKNMEIIPIDIDVMREDNEDRGLCKDIGLLIGEDDASHTRDDQIPHQSYQSLRCKCGNSEDELFEKVFDESGNSLISVRCWLCYCQIKLETIEENYCLIECVNCGNNTEDLFDKALDRDSKIVGISCHVCGTHLQFTEATNRNQQVNTGSYEPTLFVSYKKTKVTSLETLKPGDHVAWERLGGIYSHHGIVVEVKSENELEVIHNTVADDGKTANGGAKCKILKGIVQVDLSKGDLHICNYEPGECLEPDEVIARAESLLGEKNYNLLLNNCEHFATLCKTSRCFSIAKLPRSLTLFGGLAVSL